MRNLKRVLSLALALVMVLGMMVITTSAATYADEDEITQIEAVEVLSALGIVSGDGTNFNPNGTFMRRDAAKLIAYMLGYGKTAEKLSAEGLFTDVEADHWSAGYIAFCSSRGYITGVGNGQFNPKGVLKDVELGKLVLCALGYDPAKYTGADWATAVTVDLLDAKLANKVTGEAISREDACAMILNAMVWTDGGDIYTVYTDKAGGTANKMDAGEAIKVYTEAIDAYFAASAITGGKVDISSSDDYLLNTVYKAVAGSLSDVYGRPGTSYVLDDDFNTTLKYSKKPVATFTGIVSEKDFFAEIGAAGTLSVSNSNRYITMNKITEDGRQWNDSGAGPAATLTIENDDNSRVPGTGEGITVEVYSTRTKNVYEMVCIRDYAGTVTHIDEANAVAGTPRKVTVTMDVNPLGHPKSWTYVTNEFAFGDKVICKLAEDNGTIVVQTVAAAEFVSGQVTKITDGTVYTIGGKDYVLSQLNTCGAPTLGSSGSWYVDSMGNLIAVKNADFAPWSYGYLINYDYQQKVTDNTLLGNGNKTAAEKFEIITSEGKKVVYDGAFTTNKQNGKVTDWQWDANTDFTEVSGASRTYSLPADYLVRYTVNAAGAINEIEVVVDRGPTQNGNYELNGGGQTATKGAAQFDSKYVTDETIFFVYASDRDYAIYTGYKNIPLTVETTDVAGSTDWAYFYAVDKDGNTIDTTLAAVMLNVDTAEAQTDANYVYVASPSKTSEATADGTIYTYTNVYLNGTKGTLAFEETDPSASAGYLYTYVTDTKTGYATLSDSEIATKAGATEITSIQSSYFVAGSAQYFDADTVFYQVDNATGAVTEVEALPALNPAYAVKCIYAAANSVTSAADVVYFVVVAN